MERCWLQMLNETARCMEEGIIKDPADVDIGVIFGFGFPPSAAACCGRPTATACPGW